MHPPPRLRPVCPRRTLGPSPVPADGDVAVAVAVAQTLLAVGVPLFVARPAMSSGRWNPSGGVNRTGYWLPRAWQQTEPAPRGGDCCAAWQALGWQPGYALCAVLGHRLDLLDVDPRNGGDRTQAEMADIWPIVYARARTPSDGSHDYIAALNVGTRDALGPGLDLKGAVKTARPAGSASSLRRCASARRRTSSEVTGGSASSS